MILYHELDTRGGDLVLSLPGCVCPKVKEMGVKFAASLNMGKNLCQLLNIIAYTNGVNELQFT